MTSPLKRLELDEVLKGRPDLMELYARLSSLIAHAEARSRAKSSALRPGTKASKSAGAHWRRFYEADNDIAGAVLELFHHLKLIGEQT